MEKRVKLKQGLIIFLIGILLAGSVTIFSSSTAYAGTGTVTGATQITLGSSTTWSFQIGNILGTCCEPDNSTIPTAGTVVTIDKLDSSSKLAKIAYLGSQDTSDKGMYIVGHASAYVLGNATLNHYQYSTEVNAMVANADTTIVPSNFIAYLVKPNNGGQTFIAWETIPNGALKLTKTSANTDITNGNSCYSLAGAVYGLFSGNTQVGTLTTGADGTVTLSDITAGSYTLKEITPPKGYALDTKSYPITITAGQTTDISVSDLPQSDPISILLKKVDKETGEAVPTGKGTLAGAEYTVKYYAGHYATADDAIASGGAVRTWVFKTDEDAFAYFDRDFFVSGDDFFLASNGDITLPIGAITIQETKAPKGYKLDETIYIRNITSDTTAEMVNSYAEPTSPEQVIRGDLELVKIEDGTSKRMAGIPFKITSKTTGESHVIVTDDNGQAKTSSDWNAHSNNTNAGTTDTDGVWFGGTTVNDKLGALPYDTYVIDELACDNNKGHKLVTGVEVVISRDNTVINMGTITNDLKDEITLHTNVTEKGSGDKVVEAGKVYTFVDEVIIKGLTPGNTYKLTGLQMLREENAKLIIDGKEVTGETEFVATEQDMTAEVEFLVDTTGLAGQQIVTFEELYDVTNPDSPEKVGEHKEIDDEGQTITVKKVDEPTAPTPQQPNQPSNPTLPITGDTAMLGLYALIAILAGSTCVVAYKVKKAKKENE